MLLIIYNNTLYFIEKYGAVSKKLLNCRGALSIYYIFIINIYYFLRFYKIFNIMSIKIGSKNIITKFSINFGKLNKIV